MRDSHRLKEKYDVSLDNRQIGSLLIGGIVVLGAVFVLGVVVGKKLAGDQRVQEAPDLLTALDQKSAALEHVSDASLTFQDELTRNDPRPDDSRAKKPAPEPKRDPPAEPAPKKDDSKADRAVATATPAPPTVDAAEPGTPESTPTTARTADKDAGLRNAFAKATHPTETAAGGAFTLQIAASQNRADADKLAARLREKGYAPYIASAEVAGKGTWFRVRMGSFATKDAAARYLADFKQETQLEAFVASTEDHK
jgi:cell division septation protein DedD